MNRSIFINLILTLVFIFSACNKPVDNSEVIAKVGGEALTLNVLLEEIPPHIRPDLTSLQIREFVLRWINEQVLYQEAMERNLDDDLELQRELTKLKKEIMINKLIQQTIDNGVAVTDEEILEYYNENQVRFVLETDLAHAYHMVFKTQSDANKVRARLRNGEQFESVFKKNAADSLNNEQWDLGYFKRADVIPELARTVFTMQVGTHSFPIKSKFGYHVVKLVDRLKKGEVQKLEMVKQEIEEILKAKKKQDRQQRFTLQMKSKFKIETNFQLLESAIMDSLLAKGDELL